MDPWKHRSKPKTVEGSGLELLESPFTVVPSDISLSEVRDMTSGHCSNRPRACPSSSICAAWPGADHVSSNLVEPAAVERSCHLIRFLGERYEELGHVDYSVQLHERCLGAGLVGCVVRAQHILNHLAASCTSFRACRTLFCPIFVEILDFLELFVCLFWLFWVPLLVAVA